jgi:hypothetical protein
MDFRVSMQNSRRQFLKIIGLLPFVRVCLFPEAKTIVENLGDEYVLLNGWILKRTDLYDSPE